MPVQNIELQGRKYSLHYLTGKVIESSQRSETTVSGSGGGGYMWEGSGYVKPVQIRSNTVVLDRVFLIDRQGKEHALNLSNLQFECRASHELTFVWAIQEGQERGPYVLVFNHDLEQIYFQRQTLRKMYAPTFKEFFPKFFQSSTANLITYGVIVLFLVITGLIVLLPILGFIFYGDWKKRQANKHVEQIIRDFRQDEIMHSILNGIGIT